MCFLFLLMLCAFHAYVVCLMFVSSARYVVSMGLA